MIWCWFYSAIIMVAVISHCTSTIVLNISSSTNISLRTYSSLNNPNKCFYRDGSILSEEGFCFPSLIVAGFPKCGTSYLFRTLSTNPVLVATKRKELCLGGPLTENWERLILRLPGIKETENAVAMSGCLHLESNIRATTELHVDGTKLIYVVRNVADMLWASYNYWCISSLDVACTPGARSNELSKRSPQHFQEMIEQGLSMGGGISLEANGNCYRRELQLALSHFGKENVKVVKSEDFLDGEKRRGQLQSIASFIGILDRSSNWVRIESTKNQRVNAGHLIGNRGEKEISNVTDRDGLYEVSGFLPMLETTRNLINRRWIEECSWLRSEFSIVYESCRNT